MWCWYLLAGGGGAAEGSVLPDLCKVGLNPAPWKTPEGMTLLTPGGCLDDSMYNFFQSLLAILFFVFFYVTPPPFFLYFLFLFICIYSRLFFPLFSFSLILDLLSSISTHFSLVHLPPSLSLAPGGFQFLGHCSSSLFSQYGRWILPLWQREKKLKVPAKVTRQHFPFFRGF